MYQPNSSQDVNMQSTWQLIYARYLSRNVSSLTIIYTLGLRDGQ